MPLNILREMSSSISDIGKKTGKVHPLWEIHRLKFCKGRDGWGVGGQANGGSKHMVRACRRQARRLAEGQTTHLVLNMGAVQTPPPTPLPQGSSLGVLLAVKGDTIRTHHDIDRCCTWWLFKTFKSGQLRGPQMRLLRGPGGFQMVLSGSKWYYSRPLFASVLKW